MRPRRPLAALGCAAFATLALVLPGCGSGAPATPGKAAARDATSEAAASAVSGKSKAGAGNAARKAPTESSAVPSGGCRAQLGSFVESLDALRHGLVAGLTYAEYRGRVEDLRATYATISVDRLSPTCLIAVGTPSERALDVYLEAANTWAECLSKPGCTAADVETTLQDEWHGAVKPLAAARAGLEPTKG